MGLFNLAKTHAVKVAMPLNDDLDEDFSKYRRGRATPAEQAPVKPIAAPPKFQRLAPDELPDDDLRSVKWSDPELNTHLKENPQFEGGSSFEAPQKAVAYEKDMTAKIKAWAAAQYDVDHQLIPQNPFQFDPRWILEDRQKDMYITRTPIVLFWSAAKAALTTPFSYDEKTPTTRIARRPDVESYITSLVQNGKRQAAIESPQKPEKKVGPIGGMAAAADIKERYPFMETFGQILGPILKKLYRSKTHRNQDKEFGGVEEGVQNGLLTAFSETSTGIRNDLRFFAGEGWDFLTPAMRAGISAAFVKKSNQNGSPIALDDPATRAGVIKQFGPMFSEALDEWTPVLHQRLEALFRMCADPKSMRRTRDSGLRMAEDVESMDGNSQADFIDRFRKAAIKYAMTSIDMRTNTVEKAVYHKKKNEENATRTDVNVGGKTFDATEQRQSADQLSNDALIDKARAGSVSTMQIDSINEVKREIRDAVLPVISKQLIGIADDLDNLGTLVSKAMRIQQQKADVSADPRTGVKFQRGRRIEFAREYSALFKMYADFVARELRTAANDATGHKLLPILLSVAHEQGLLPVVPEMSKQLKNTDMLEFRDGKGRAGNPAQTLGSVADPSKGVAAVQSHSVLGNIWNMSKPTEDTDPVDTHLGRINIPGRSDLARRLNLGLIVRSPKFTEMLRSGRAMPATGHKPGPDGLDTTNPTQRKTWPHIPEWAVDPNKPETGLDQRGKARANTKSRMMTQKELQRLRDNLPQLFPWWSNFMVLPEVMQSTSAVARQVFMDSLPVREQYKAGLGDGGKNVYKYYYAGIYGLQNAPAFYDTKKTKQVSMTPMDAASYIHECQQEARAKNRTFRHEKLREAISREVHLLKLANRMSKFASADRTIVDRLLADVRQISAMLLEW